VATAAVAMAAVVHVAGGGSVSFSLAMVKLIVSDAAVFPSVSVAYTIM